MFMSLQNAFQILNYIPTHPTTCPLPPFLFLKHFLKLY